jgi:hypothetical protein
MRGDRGSAWAWAELSGTSALDEWSGKHTNPSTNNEIKIVKYAIHGRYLVY